MLSARVLSAQLCACLVLCLGPVAGCGGDLSPLPIALEFRDELPGQCPSNACSDYGLDCGAVVSVRVFDASSNPFGDPEPLVESCVAVSTSENLCTLAESAIDLGDLPAQRVRVEVAMWDPAAVGTTCPSGPMFDLGGLPLTTFDPQPAFGGSRIIDAGDEDLDLATIELACFDTDPLGQCGGGTTEVIAQIDDLDTLLFAPPFAVTNLRVSIGTPQQEPGPGGETVFVIDAADDYELQLTRTVPVPEFRAVVPTSFDELACLQVLDVAPQATTAVTCTELQGSSEILELTGYLVKILTVEQLLMLLGEESFPSAGLVVGRVVDDAGQPSAGVTVTATTPTGGQAEILYVSEDFDAITTTGPTASHGFFVSRESPFGSRWTATHLDGRQERIAPRTGLIQGKVTALVIPLDIAVSTANQGN